MLKLAAKDVISTVAIWDGSDRKLPLILALTTLPASHMLEYSVCSEVSVHSLHPGSLGGFIFVCFQASDRGCAKLHVNHPRSVCTFLVSRVVFGAHVGTFVSLVRPPRNACRMFIRSNKGRCAPRRHPGWCHSPAEAWIQPDEDTTPSLTVLPASLASFSWRLLAMQAAMADVTSMVLFFSLSSAFQALLLALTSAICCVREEDGKRGLI